MNIVVDSCFWIALYDKREEDHQWANETWERLQDGNKFLVPYPTMYEFINTRLMRRKDGVEMFRVLFGKQDSITRVSDEEYREDALHVTLQPSMRTLSLVDTTIRLMLEDDRIKKHAMLTMNIGDFMDVCLRKGIKLISKEERVNRG